MEGIKTFDVAVEEGATQEVASEYAGEATDRPKEVNTVATLLYVMAGLSLFDVVMGDPGGIFQIGFNLFLGHHLKQLKPWARTWILIRAVGGILAGFFIFGLNNANSGQMPVLVVAYLINVVFCIAMIGLLMREEVKWAFKKHNN